ncbi:MAG: UDP-3-O-(3-hydroxymyristoyl)glucosamine N-acyltransferase [Rhodocyclaceae bacterium]|nr:UDP-3-O-(3-hydroxymyristoyl)glucosamine N-acyltransferase [Rhodocyclaceae bacterium]MBK6553405.1 UDP-3-O-(3-hydroxymyristoyl)glucosamine N-acyltransferase [Rhodocyclaceae bacterium]MBK9311552.1 UDP-3-O-(3-hydroxymyristoyl)glucosamine N-acyltransferase [Rhodocyclaceae bacterium]
MSLRLDEIVARLGGQLAGSGDVRVSRVATLDGAGRGDLSFLANPKYRPRLATTRASAVIVPPDAVAECPAAAIVTPRPYLYFARVAQWLHAPLQPPCGAHPSAVVQSILPASASIDANAQVAADVTLGDDVVIGANCVIGPGCRIGAGSWLHAGVTLYRGCIIGARAIIHSGAVIGADGFGFARDDDGVWEKIPQTGRVVIGDDVEVGANTTIDRGAIDDTVIEDGVKLDNQIQIAHNVRIGAHTAMAGCVGVAGSTRIGRRCTVGGAAMILGHLTIGDDVNISSGTLVMKSIVRPGTYTGSVPFLDHADWLKNFSRLRHLEDMADRIRLLEARLADLEKKT